MKSLVALFVALSTVSMLAQQPPSKPAPPKPPAAPAAPAPVAAPAPPAPVAVPRVIVDPSGGGQSVNIRLDVSVIDQKDNAVGQPKTLMVILADKALGQARAAYEDRSVSVDARPTIVDGLIRVNVTINSQEPPKGMPTAPDFNKSDPLLNWSNSFALLLQSGKPMVALETSDAVTKRKMSIEVKATILK